MRVRTFLCMALFALAIGARPVPAQTMGGQVVDVIDGRTIVIEHAGTRTKAELQFIEVPGDGQELNKTVKDHLRSLVVGKSVEYRPRSFVRDRSIGRVTLNGVDVSMQMLRDGAAWHLPKELSGQSSDEFVKYAEMAASAKADKLGVWGVAGLQPPREVAKAARLAESASAGAYRLDAPKKSTYWGDKNPKLGDIGPLHSGFNARDRLGYVGTPLLGIEKIDKMKDPGLTGTVDLYYHYKEEPIRGRTGLFVLTLRSTSTNAKFAKDNDLILVDDKNRFLAKAKRTVQVSENGVSETLVYQLTRSDISSVLHSNGNLKIADFRIFAYGAFYMILHNLLEVSGPSVKTAEVKKPAKKG